MRATEFAHPPPPPSCLRFATHCCCRHPRRRLLPRLWRPRRPSRRRPTRSMRSGRRTLVGCGGFRPGVHDAVDAAAAAAAAAAKQWCSNPCSACACDHSQQQQQQQHACTSCGPASTGAEAKSQANSRAAASQSNSQPAYLQVIVRLCKAVEAHHQQWTTFDRCSIAMRCRSPLTAAMV